MPVTVHALHGCSKTEEACAGVPQMEGNKTWQDIESWEELPAREKH